nr:hypothetical protein [Tanacetum cinerariifolium]
MVLYDSKENLVDLVAEQESKDDVDLDKQPLSKRFKIMYPIPKEPTPSRDESKGKGKEKKKVEFVKEVFVTEDVIVDGMGKNLIPPPRVIPIQGLVISEPES